MTVEYEQGQAELIALQRQLLQDSPTVQRLVRRQRFGYPLFFVLAGLLLGAINPSRRLTSWLGFGLAALAWSLFYPALVELFLRQNSRKLVSQGRAQGSWGHQTVTLSANSLTVRSLAGEKRHGWKSISRLEQNDHWLFLYTGPAQAYVVPRSAFVTAGEWQQFIALCQQYRQA